MNWKAIVDSTVNFVVENRDGFGIILVVIFLLVIFIVVPFYALFPRQRKQ